MFCYNCGTKLVDGAKFCSVCGTKQPLAQPNSVNTKTVTKSISIVQEEEDTGINYPIGESKRIHFNKELIEYIKLRKPFEENALVVTNTFICICDNNDEVGVNSFDDIIEKALPAWKAGMNISINLGVQTLINKSIDYVDADSLWSQLNDSLNKVTEYIDKNIAIIEAFQKQLQNEDDSSGPWVGGGFGFSGALKGAVEAELLNAGASMVSGIFKSITGNTTNDKIRNLKEKIYANMKQEKILTHSLYNMSCEVFDYVYDVLSHEGIEPQIFFDKKKTLGKYHNLMKQYEDGTRNDEQVISGLCECIEGYPYYIDYITTLYKILPDIMSLESLTALVKDLGLWDLCKNNEKENLIRITFIQEQVSADKVKTLMGTINDNINSIVVNQAQLEDKLSNMEDTSPSNRLIGLFENTYTIPLDKFNIKYIGVGINPTVVKFNTNQVIDFEKMGIEFVQIEFDEMYKTLLQSSSIISEGEKALEEDNYLLAIEKFTEAADMNNGDAACYLGWMFKEGIGVQQSENKAKDFFAKAEGKAGRALYNIGKNYEKGLHGCQQNSYKAKIFYEKCGNNPMALKALGDLYDLRDFISETNGSLVKLHDKAKLFYRQAIDLGNYEASYALGMIYLEEISINSTIREKNVESYDDHFESPDFNEVVQCFENAAAHDVPDAVFVMGTFYEQKPFNNNGEDLLEEAINRYKKASELGSNKASYRLGQLCWDGIGVIKSTRIAISYWEKAAKAGNDKAMVALGICYANGEGTTQNYNKAVEFYKKAIVENNDEAMYNLGMCYYYGAGVPKDEEKAKNLYIQAANYGNEDAKKALKETFNINK